MAETSVSYSNNFFPSASDNTYQYESSTYIYPFTKSQDTHDTKSQVTMGNKKKEKKTTSFPFGKCRICQDKATGLHYGVITCEGCKGFFKRSIIQGIPYRCFFGDKCIINIDTRNRCKACRFKRCIEQGMGMENVKMGRIPKSIKEKALKIHTEQVEDTLKQNEDYDEMMEMRILDELNNFDVNSLDLANEKNDSVTSSSDTSNAYEYAESHQNTVIREDTHTYSDQRMRTLDLIELTMSSSNIPMDNLTNGLSTLQIPPVFYDSSFYDENLTLEKSTQSYSNEKQKLSESSYNINTMTVSRYITNLNENAIIDYMFNCELRYSKHVLPMMNYLEPKLRQPFLIYELDAEVTSFFRYIRWKMFQYFVKHTERLRMQVERMLGIINLGITNYPGCNATFEQMWNDVLASITVHVEEFLSFSKNTPGLNELNQKDFNRILNNRIFDFWLIINYPLFYKNESYIMTVNGLHYTRYFMNRFIGKQTTDCFHEFSQRLHQLKITEVEHSLMIPIILCSSDKELIDSKHVQTIKYCYMYALYIQLSTTRTEEEAKTVFNTILQVIDSIPVISDLCKKNIGELELDKEKYNR